MRYWDFIATELPSKADPDMHRIYTWFNTESWPMTNWIGGPIIIGIAAVVYLVFFLWVVKETCFEPRQRK